jgi:hypothetical protein
VQQLGPCFAQSRHSWISLESVHSTLLAISKIEII